MRRFFILLTALTLATAARAQDPGTAVPSFEQKRGGSEKVHMLGHVVAHPGPWKAADIEMEQDPTRPYVYLCGFVNFDVQIYDISNTSAPEEDLRVDDRESRAAPRHRRDGRQVLQDRQPLLLRAVVPVHAGQPGRRPRRRDLRRHRPARSERR